MYESFFGLKEKPFNLTPNPRYLFLSEGHEEALSALVYGIIEKKGLITLTGPVGVGKTTILYSFFDQLKGKADTAFFPAGIRENVPTFFKELCTQLGIATDKDPDYGLLEEVKKFALDSLKRSKRVVLLIDEAQDLSVEALNTFRYLNNLETPDAKLLQIVLVGTEELDTRLMDERLISLRQRVAIRCAIKPLDPESALEYIFHRVTVAGNSADNLFTAGALWQIVNYARGIPRLINVVCDNAMILAFALKQAPVEETCAVQALHDLDMNYQTSDIHEIISREAVVSICRVLSRRMKEKTQGVEISSPIQPTTAPPRETQTPHRGESLSKDHPPAPLTAPITHAEHVDAARIPKPSLHPSRMWIVAFLVGGLVLGVLVLFGSLWKRTPGQIRVPIASQGERSNKLKSDRNPVEEPKAVTLPRQNEPSPEQEPNKGQEPEQPFLQEQQTLKRTGLKETPQPQAEEEKAELREVPQGQVKSGAGGLVETQPHGPASVTAPSVQEAPLAGKEPSPQVPSAKETPVLFNNKDLGAIALERYQTLDLTILRMLRGENPQIQDWNRLGAHVEIHLPQLTVAEDSTIDFYAVQLISTLFESKASEVAQNLSHKKVQNVFVVKHSPSPVSGKSWICVCAGVFEAPRESLELIGTAREWGFRDAFVTRLQGLKLQNILKTYPRVNKKSD